MGIESAVIMAVFYFLAADFWCFLTDAERQRLVAWISNAWTTLAIIVLSSLALAGLAAAIARKRPAKPHCSCIKLIGDDPHCLMHRDVKHVEIEQA